MSLSPSPKQSPVAKRLVPGAIPRELCMIPATPVEWGGKESG